MPGPVRLATGAGRVPEQLTVTCTNCPVTLPDLVGGTGEITGVDLPSGCE